MIKFFFYQKKVLKNGSSLGWVAGWVGLTWKKKGRVTGQPIFASGQKNGVWVKYFSGWSKNSNPFCHRLPFGLIAKSHVTLVGIT